MANCERLEWVNEPNIPPCAVGEPADFRGLTFYAIYDDGSKQEVPVVLRTFHERNLQEVGTERVGQVIYEKKRLSARIPLKNTVLISIQAHPIAHIYCFEGEPFDRSQVTVTAFYSDGSSRVIDNYKIAPHQELSLSDKKITFRYGRCVSELPIAVQTRETQGPPQAAPDMSADPLNPTNDSPMVNRHSSVLTRSPVAQSMPAPSPKTVAAISVAKKPNRQKYLVNDTMVDLKGGRLDIIYSDGTVGQIDMTSDGVIYIDSKKTGIGYISFTCLGKPVSFPIDVLEPQIVKLTVAKLPAKLDYEEGEELDLAGLVLEVVYNDGSVRTVRGLQSNGFIVGRGHADEGVTLSYEGEPFTVRVNVKKKEVPVTALSVNLVHEPNKVKYIENDPQGLDLTGAELLVQMSDGRRLSVPVTSDMVDPVDLSRPGRCLLNIRHMGHTVVCSVFVDAKALRRLELISYMEKTEYIEGEKIDMRGLVVEACYNNGERISVENYTVSPERAAIGNKEVRISYSGAELAIPIVVHPLEVTLLDWARKPLKTVYYTHEKEFLCDGGVLRVRRNNKTEDEIPLLPEMVSGFRTDRIGTQLLSIAYEGKAIPLTVTVKERILLGLRTVKMPRTEYVEGEIFDPAGLVVEALYTGETAEEVKVSYLPYGPLTLGIESMMLVYQDKAVVLPISVSARPAPDSEPDSPQSKHIETHTSRFVPETEPVAPDPKPASVATPVAEDLSLREMEEVRVEPEEGSVPKPIGNTVTSTLEQNQKAKAAGNNNTDGVGTDIPKQKRKWMSVPPFYPSTFCIRFSEELAF